MSNHHVSSPHRVAGLTLVDHEFQVPLNHNAPEQGSLNVYGREVVAAGKEHENLPWLAFLQGGPGFGSPRPLERSGWMSRAVDSYRVLLLDQRGTGRSTPVGYQSLAQFETAEDRADYLRLFRCDAIVADLEHIRQQLDIARWSVLGQSYGGFCVVRYLSVAPGGLREALITGGLPPLAATADDVYRATYPQVLRKNALYYQRYPEDVPRVQAVVRHLQDTLVKMPSGEPLSPRRFQQLGLGFGMSDGFEAVHYLIEEAFVAGKAGPELSYAFLRGVENQLPFQTNPIYALLHEAAYTQGVSSRWSAERLRAEYPAFRIRHGQPVYFTGEMIYPWMFDEYPTLRRMKEEAMLLAEFSAWPQLYHPERLRENEVPCAAVIYHDDMYVWRGHSEQTAATIKGIKTWITNEYEHNGLRADGKAVLGRLLDMLRTR